jgi:nucleoside-triphosphatase THEP1
MSTGISDRDPPFHAQSDIAALVFGRSENPDFVLSEFVSDLESSGKRVAGMLQLGRQADAHRDHAIHVTLLLHKRDMTLSHRVLPQPVCCGLETRSLHELSDAVTADIRSGADVVIINRFGRLEVEGGGFVQAIATAAALDIPVIVAVPEGNFRSWIAYSGGMSVRLSCNRSNIESWWSSVSAPSVDAARCGPATICEMAK